MPDNKKEILRPNGPEGNRKASPSARVGQKHSNQPELTPFTSHDLRYEEWQDSAAGKCSQQALELLSRRMSAGWPRRGHNLLELFCADGHFLEMFWQSGFDVTGQDQSSFLLSKARERLKNAAEFIQMDATSLPYDDGAFDYVVCLSGMQYAENPEALVNEMFRLAAKGVLLAFPSSWSLHFIGNAFRRSRTKQEGEQAPKKRYFSPVKISSLINQAGEGSSNWASALIGPAWSWKIKQFWRLNYINFPFPLGAVTIVRIDLDAPLGGNQLTVTAKRQFKREAATNSLGRVSKSGKPE